MYGLCIVVLRRNYGLDHVFYETLIVPCISLTIIQDVKFTTIRLII